MSHLNLHKTFCIPHGGGGPGVGPVARARPPGAVPALARRDTPSPREREGIGPVSAAPYGSAGILPISWAYVRMMGAEGLTAATATAVLSANYVAARLGEHFPVLYKGHGGLVAHECILDLRGLTKATGVTVDDVAKRLVDYGFHAPTMSFPVAGTLMVEPTESEDLAEIDRFCEAMIAIRGEIDRVEAGEWSPETSPLRGAPHTSRALAGEWDRAYAASSRCSRPARDAGQVLAAGRPHRPGLRRPQPGLLVPVARGVRRARRRVSAPVATLTARRLDVLLAREQVRRPAALGGRPACSRDGVAGVDGRGAARGRRRRPGRTRSTGSARSPRP